MQVGQPKLLQVWDFLPHPCQRPIEQIDIEDAANGRMRFVPVRLAYPDLVQRPQFVWPQLKGLSRRNYDAFKMVEEIVMRTV